jgi:CRP/FNR family cyclic AMP-dependent transcriptional regulator
MDLKSKYISVLAKTPIFSAIEKSKLLELYEKCEIITVENEKAIIEEDTEAEEIYVVLDGGVDILLKKDKKHIIVASFGVGHCVGEASVIGIQNHSATVVAKGHSTFLILTRPILMSLYSNDLPLFALLVLNIARELARRLKDTDHYLETHQ